MVALLLATALLAPPGGDYVPSQRFLGALSDGAGTVRFRLRGKRISHASAQVFGRSYVLRPSEVTDDGELQLVGNAGTDYIRIKARLRRGGRWVSGTYVGSVDRKKTEGRFAAARR